MHVSLLTIFQSQILVDVQSTEMPSLYKDNFIKLHVKTVN